MALWAFVGEEPLTKEAVMAYKKNLIGRGYAINSINSMLASVNAFLDYLGLQACKVKNIRIQRQTYCTEDKELSKEEYLRLLKASGNNEQLNLVIQTICATGIRVSELQYFTAEAVRAGQVTVACKNKTRTILVPGKLRKLLLNYAKRKQILSGVFPLLQCRGVHLFDQHQTAPITEQPFLFHLLWCYTCMTIFRQAKNEPRRKHSRPLRV